MKTATNFAERYLDDRLVYDFNLTPAQVPSLEDAYLRGINCTLLARFVQQDLYDYALPAHLMCTEMFYDTEHFTKTNAVEHEALQPGDLVWFGRSASQQLVDEFVPIYNAAGQLTNWRHLPVNHVGIATGETSANGPVILHAVEKENVTLWPIEQFKDVRRYSVVWAVSRLKIAGALA
jgi:hypothetical protein